MMKKWAIYGLVFIFVSCSTDDSAKLPSVEERSSEAIQNLQDLLMAPANGWRIDYRPTGSTGSFFILLDFNDDGMVRVQSDVVANDGEFRDASLPYRIDSSQGLELILETYGVFHYLFELEQATFGGEFEFIFEEEEGNNLIFSSKTDAAFGDNTTLTFVPAGANDASLISTSALGILSSGIFQTPNLGSIGDFGTFNIYVPANDHTISAVFDANNRIVRFFGAGVGQTQDEIIANNNTVSVNLESTFSLETERIVLDQAQSISLAGQTYSISEIPIPDSTLFVDSFCTGQNDTIVSITGSNPGGLGDFVMNSSLFQVENSFPDGEDGFYNINHVFIYDENDNSISDDIEAVFPGVVGFQWYQNFEVDTDSTFNAVGFVSLDDFNNAEFFLRKFDVVRNGGYMEITFRSDNFISIDDPTTEELNGLESLTDQIFAGGTVYVMEVGTIDGLLEFYNPCNRYKGFLF